MDRRRQQHERSGSTGEPRGPGGEAVICTFAASSLPGNGERAARVTRGVSGAVRQCLAGGAAVRAIDTVFTWCALTRNRNWASCSLLDGALRLPGRPRPHA